jgi:hypothetical protein
MSTAPCSACGDLDGCHLLAARAVGGTLEIGTSGGEICINVNKDAGWHLTFSQEQARLFVASIIKKAKEAAMPIPLPPHIVCLCGSTRFKQAFIEANFRETMAGRIVLSVGWFSHADAAIYTPTQEEKIALDDLHKRKIDHCDEVLVLNVGGYIGESTRSEIAYARQVGKKVRFLEEVSPCSPS